MVKNKPIRHHDLINRFVGASGVLLLGSFFFSNSPAQFIWQDDAFHIFQGILSGAIVSYVFYILNVYLPEKYQFDV